MKPITIIIPNYNGAHLLRKNIPSVLEGIRTYPGQAQLLVVDDGSADASLDVLAQNFPSIRVIAHEINKGFSEAVLTGVQAADTELLFLLNSDIELHQGCIEKLEPYFSLDDTFSATPLMLDEDCSVNRHSWNLRSFERGYLKLVDWSLEQARALRAEKRLLTLYSSGGCMLVSRSKFLSLGGFHPIFKPYYGEDYDLGMRAWYRSWPSYFEPNATLTHQSQGSIKDSAKRSKVKEVRRRNRYLLEWIHFSRNQLILKTLPYSALQILGEILTFDKTNIRGFWTATKLIPEALRARADLEIDRNLGLENVINKLHAQLGPVKKIVS
jgi:GT2 family glycosyltransferase